MTSLEWTTIQTDSNSARPSCRWGHSCCIINQDLYLFGGFANSNYLNDLWRYSLMEASWSELATFGDTPSPRSNATLNYDPHTNQLLMFGGGGFNKQRFNSIFVMDLTSLEWIELLPFENQPAPWERTYHTAEFSFPYLIVFGGEGVEDLGDLWLYNFQSLAWREVKMQGIVWPRARRFHSSCINDDSIFVFGGCEGKYNCIGDLYELDLARFKETDNIEDLAWKEVRLKSKVTPRWGQSMHFYDGLIYIFGGRASDDLDDLFSIDPNTGEVKAIKAEASPKARRRHSGGFIGSCLVLFGGFDGNYYNDHFYINLYSNINKTVQKQQQTQEYANHQVASFGGPPYPINTSLIAKYFNSEENMADFLQDIDGFYEHKVMEVIYKTLVQGYGELPLLRTHQRWMAMTIPFQKSTNKDVAAMFRIDESAMFGMNGHVAYLESYQLASYLTRIKQHWQYQHSFTFNSEPTYVNKELLLTSSPFFSVLFNNDFKQQQVYGIERRTSSLIQFQLVLAYLHTGLLVVPSNESHRYLVKIAELAQYFGIEKLSNVCEEELIYRLNPSNHQEMKEISVYFDFARLSQQCSMLHLNQLMADRKGLYLPTLSIQEESMDKKTRQLYNALKFDLVHNRKETKMTRELNCEENENVAKENKQGNGVLSKKESLRK